LPDLPNKISNSNGAIFNGELYVFSENDYNIIFKLNLSNLDSYISKTLKNLDRIYFEEEENNLISNNNNNNNNNNNVYDYNNNGLISWTKIEFNINNGKLHRGMGIISLGTNIYLFGGFDSQNLYNDFYIISFKDKGFFKDIENNNKKTVQKIKENVKEKIANFKNDIKEKSNEIYNQFIEGLKIARNEYDDDNNIINNENLNEINNNVANNLINIINNNNNFDINLNNNNNDEDKINIIKQRIDLPCQTFFNSNIVSFENNLIVMIDSNNNAIEYDVKLKQFYYYFS
jgi:hypothetical protein